MQSFNNIYIHSLINTYTYYILRGEFFKFMLTTVRKYLIRSEFRLRSTKTYPNNYLFEEVFDLATETSHARLLGIIPIIGVR